MAKSQGEERTGAAVAIAESRLRTNQTAYNLGMKRDVPVTCCTKCFGAGYNIKVAGGRCCKNSGGQRCDGINAIATNSLDWGECTHCEATGYYRNKECPECKGAGYVFIGLRTEATV